MGGEWDVLDEFYGPFGFHDSTMSEIVTIIQKGAKFSAIKQIGRLWVLKGAETIKGELISINSWRRKSQIMLP
jgi:hypothetical protein